MAAVASELLVPVHRLVEEQARLAPDALAASRGDDSLTYAELDAWANELAAVLAAQGVGIETRVAFLMERSLELLAAFLATYKLGAAGILLDPAWPHERVARCLAAADPLVTLTGADVPRDGRAAPPDVDVHLDTLAYLVQTSGSTGTPKSVGVTSRSVAHCVATHRQGYRIHAGDRSSWVAPPGSSAAVGELWPFLASGASVHVAEPEVVASPAELQEWLLRAQITKTYVGMPLAELLYLREWPREAALELMVVGSDSVRTWPPAELPFEVAVSYGSAEANGVCTCLVPWSDRLTSATAGERERGRRPPIGRPWPDVEALVLDERLEAVPPSELGELYVSSCELARGYVDDPRLTAERFLPHPGGRLYKTGDLVCRREDGLLEHRGRVDDQVKIRGQRVEPAEVEAVLLAHSAVESVVVVARGDPAGERRLVAYYVSGRPAPPAELRAFAAERLPDYMVPRVYTVLPELPLSANRKVDRAALPEPDWERDDVAPAGAPGDGLEAELRALWAEIVGGPEPAPDVHLLREAGGDSLAAGRLVGAVRDRYGVRLRLRDFLREPTPAALARQTRQLRRQQA
ncbi:MAG TPA: non-ribosomal peptide synthetase [Gaiellaceae bacterium]